MQKSTRRIQIVNFCKSCKKNRKVFGNLFNHHHKQMLQTKHSTNFNDLLKKKKSIDMNFQD